MKEIKIALKNAKDMEEFVKINATKTTIDSKGNVKCDIEGTLETYFLIYDDEKLTSIIKKCIFNGEDVYTVKYVVEYPKEISIYGLKINYTSQYKDIVNEYINSCNCYMRNECGVEIPTITHVKMYDMGLCDTLNSDIVKMKYGYDLV